MADSTTTTTSTEVTVMSADQVTQLITAITGSLTELKTAVVTELTSIKTSIDGVKTQLQTSATDLSATIGSVKTQIETSANAIASKIDASNTKLESLKTTITSHGTTVADSVDGLADGISDISSNLKVDVTTNTLNLEHDTKTGVKSLAYIEASAHALNLKRIKEAEEEMNGTSPEESSGDSGSEPEPDTSSVIDDVQDNAAEVFGELVGYEFNVTEDERITFKTPADFEESRIGLAFDYTRYFYEKAVDVVDNTEVKEYALLVFESYMKTSGDLGSTAIQRMKTWVDLKLIQTVVFTKDTESGKVVVYFPTQDKFDALDTEIYKNEKAAQDAVVKKYQGIINDQYKGIAFIPVDTIEPGITLEEYRTAAKNITPTCEYT